VVEMSKLFWLVPYLAGVFLAGIAAFSVLFGGITDRTVLQAVFGVIFIVAAYGIYKDIQTKKREQKG